MANKKLLNIRVIFLLVISTGFEPVNAAVKGQCVKPLHQLTKKMVGLGGLEPPTSRLSGVRSNQLSYNPIFMHKIYGVPLGIRTLDPLIKSQLLYQLS